MSTTAVPSRSLAALPDAALAEKRRPWYSQAPIHVVIILISVIWLMPTIALLFTSLRNIQNINTSMWWTLLWKPHELTLENYNAVVHSTGTVGMGQAFLNSLLITIPATLFPILFGAGAAYAFAWMRFPLRNSIFLLLVGLQVVPLQMLLIPLLQMYTTLGINGTYPALWIAHTAFGLPLAIYILRNFMSGIPYELLESARIDGNGHLGIFFRIILPLTTPAIAAVAIFQFMWVWNDLLIALVFSGPSTAPMTVVVRSLVGQFGNGWHLMTAAAFISMALPLVIFFSLQRYFVTGLTAGSVKG
ncbi:MAG: ABC-type transporter, integral rane subunit [Chloroflexi bacterium]|nr:ABC-type transporter, integral rane subunit [Chloroflexota bacterium]MDB5076868.1 ABC-type transporter, integral rane subunit [Chloroflexota bacterium]